MLVVQGDVTSEADVQGAIEQIEQKLGPLRGVVHAAGVLDDGVIGQQSWDAVRGGAGAEGVGQLASAPTHAGAAAGIFHQLFVGGFGAGVGRAE